MIERYSITCSADKIRERFNVDVPDFYRKHYNAAPTQLLPVITNSSPHGVSLFYWGIPPSWAKNKTVSEKVINLKVESLQEKPSLRRVMLNRRCIIPADGFYAWKKIGKRSMIPYRFVPGSGEPFSFAGIWEDFEDQNGEESSTFIILTATANDDVQSITDRMPVILSPESEKLWLSEKQDEAVLFAQLTARADSTLSAYTVSPRINTSTEDVPSLIAPAPPADQHGNLTLFD